MGVKFRKSVNLGSGVRVNLSKKGVGASVGTKGVRVTKKAAGGTYSTITASGTGLSYRTKERSKKNSASLSNRRKYSSTNYSGISGGSYYSSNDIDPVIAYKKRLIELRNELEQKEKEIEKSKLAIKLVNVLQILLCVLIVTIPLIFFYQRVKKHHRMTIELLELDVVELKAKIKRMEADLAEVEPMV